MNAPRGISTSGCYWPTTRRHVITFLSWARQQRILRNVEVPVLSTEGAEAPPPGSDARLAAIQRLLDETFALGDRLAGCLVVLYGQQASKIAALRTTDVSCSGGGTRLKLGTDWLDVPGPVATLLRQHPRNRTNMTTAANPASPWLFPGQLASEHRSYRQLVRVLRQLGLPARASRLAAWRELARDAPPAVLADALGVWPDTAMRHAFLAGADWSAYATRRSAPALTTRPRSRVLPVTGICPRAGTRNCLQMANPAANVIIYRAMATPDPPRCGRIAGPSPNHGPTAVPLDSSGPL